MSVNFGTRRSAQMNTNPCLGVYIASCWFCNDNATGKYNIRGEYVCGKCWNKFNRIPAHIPLNQILRYHRALRKKTMLAKKLRGLK